MPRNRRQVRQDFANSLRHYAIKSRLNTPDTLGSAVRLVAHLGGYRGRTHDPEPGNQIMWQGYSTLTKATIGHEFGFEDGKRYMLEQVQKYVVQQTYGYSVGLGMIGEVPSTCSFRFHSGLTLLMK